jgi:hypothetical protein
MPHQFSRREILKSALGSAAAAKPGLTNIINPAPKLDAATNLSGRGSSELPWYRRLWVGMEVGPSGVNQTDSIFYSRASGQAIVESLLKANVDYAVIFMKDQDFAYYNSNLARRCPGLGGRDLLREITDAASKHSLPIVAYCQIQYDTSAWWAHPEWRMEDWNGNSIGSRLCYNSGYLDYTKKVAAELMQYEIVGFHFDMLDFGFSPPYGCFCENNCQPRFRDEYKMEMPRPAKPTWDAGWEKILEFRANSNTRFCRELQTFVHATRADVAVDYNYHGYPPFSWVVGELPVRNALNGDFVTAESLPWIFGYNNPSLLSLFLAGARPGGPTQVATSRSMYEYYDPTIRPLADMSWEVSTCHAHGAQVTIVDKIRYDGTQDPLVYERIGKVFGEAKSKQQYLGHRPLQEVGLYYSARSRNWFGQEEPGKYMHAFWGAHKALMDSHLTMGMIMDENVSAERLREFAVVYVPNAAIISEKEAQLFQDYANDGGKLLFTGLSGLFDSYGRQQDKSALTNLIGARVLETILTPENNFVRLPESLGGEERILLRDVPADWPMLINGPISRFEAIESTPLGELLVPYHAESDFGRLLSPEKVVAPAIFVNTVGKGRVMFVACAPDHAFVGDYRLPEHRYLIRNLIRYLNPQPLIAVEAPPNVEIVLQSDDANHRLLVHLMCFSSPATFVAAPLGKGKQVLPPPMETPMRYEARLTLNRPYSGVSSANSESEVRSSGRQIRLTTAAIHEVLIIKV